MRQASRQTKAPSEKEPHPRRPNLFFIGFVGLWMFVLGLLIGRGTVGPQFDARHIEKELEALKQEFVEKQQQLSKLLKSHTINPHDSDTIEKLESSNSDSPRVIEPIPKDILAKKKEAEARALEALRKREAARKEAAAAADGADGTASPEGADAGDPQGEPAVPLPPEPEPPAGEAAEPPVNLTIQVAAVKEPDVAIKMVAQLKKEGFAAYTTPIYLNEKGVWYRVRVGKFSQRSEAEQALQQLMAGRHSGRIVNQ